MKTGGGDFSADAYKQLREAYDKEQQLHVDDELAGTKLMGQEYGLETLPVDSPWKDKIENWQYPSGRGQYLDEHQSPEEIIKVMREAAQERLEAKTEETSEDKLEEMSDEEFDSHVDKVLSEIDATEEVEEAEETEEAEAEDEDEDEVVEETVESEPAEGNDEEGEEEDEDEGLVQQDPEDIAAEIAALRAELDAVQFIPEEEPETDDESE